MKIKESYIKTLVIIFTWALILNIVVEFMFIFMSMNSFSRIGALFVYYETWGRRNYTNTLAVTPDELVGYWVIESSNSDDFKSHVQYTMTMLMLHPDQTFEIVYPANNYSVPPNIPQKFNEQYSHGNEMIHLRGKWGTIAFNESRSISRARYTALVYGKYEGEKEYVSLGQVLDRHVATPHNRFAIKWWRGEDESELRPARGVYLKKSPAKLGM